MFEPIAVKTASAGDQLMIRAVGDEIDIRIFSRGAGPAQVLMPTAKGFAVPAAILPALIEGLQQAEATARAVGAIGGDA